MTFDNRVKFDGTLDMPAGAILSLTKDFHLPAYIDAFGDEETAFRKAFQSLLNNADHESLDLGGRRITVTGPIDMQAALANKTSYATRRHIRNGQFDCAGGPAFDTVEVTSQATYSPARPDELIGVANIAAIRPGALVTGTGVGREVYVRAVDIPRQSLTLSLPLHGAAGTQDFTFRRFAYLLDFSGFDRLDKFSMSDIEFQCSGDCSGVLLPPSGIAFQLRDCFVTRPKDRGITSHGEGCQGLLIDRCQFLSDESAKPSQERVSIALNANANDIKLRNNRVVHMRHFAVIAGTGSIISGNHFFQGDNAPQGIRTPGLVLTRTNARATINGNYIDNCFVEWGNEHDAAPDLGTEFSFSGLNITDNICLCSDVAPWFAFLVIKPHGTGHYVNGMNVSGNIFRAIHGAIDRVERVDTSHAGLDFDRVRNVTFAGNMFNAVETGAMNPLLIRHTEAAASPAWAISCAPKLPFGGWAQEVEAVVANGPIQDAGGAGHFGMPNVETRQGPDRDQITLNWGAPVEGTVTVRVRMDDTF